jgi:hypothetical protein
MDVSWDETITTGLVSCAVVVGLTILLFGAVRGCEISSNENIEQLKTVERICEKAPNACATALITIEDQLY